MIRCEDCRFWDKPHTTQLARDGKLIDSALCRRAAPDSAGSWAATLATDWCGEAGRKEDDDDDDGEVT